LRKECKVSKSVRGVWLRLVFLIAGASVQPALAMGGGGPRVSAMTRQYCTEVVVKKGITDVTRFEQEVRKCVDDPLTYK
jgi:hypothetical protein